MLIMKDLVYRKIAESISRDIGTGKALPGSRLPGVRELASEWNTSPNTVLKALSILESEGYLSKTRGQGIFVASEAGWKGGAEKEIELLVYDMKVPFNTALVDSIERYASECGCRLSVKSFRNVAGAAAELKPGSGRIIIPESAPDVFRNGKAPVSPAVVCVGEFSPPDDFGCSYAVADTYGGFYRAAIILLASGRERLGYIGATDRLEDEPGWNACRDVLSGTKAGFRREYAVSAGGWDAARGREAMENLLLAGDFPDGIICCNDALAAGALKACSSAGLSVPGDIAVVGAGDQTIAALLDPPLTSLSLPAAMIGLTVVSYLDSVLSGRIPGGGTAAGAVLRSRFDPDLKIRESFVPASDPAEEKESGSDFNEADELTWL